MTVNEAMKRMLLADGETSRCLAIGELLERLLAAGGVRRDKIGPISAALLVLWQVDCSADDAERAWADARAQAREALESGGLDVDLLTKLGLTVQQLGRVAIELQGEKLLSVVTPQTDPYVPEVGDLAFWLGKHIVRVETVDKVTVVDGASEGTCLNITVKSAGGSRLQVSPRELELYHREGYAPGGDHMLAGG